MEFDSFDSFSELPLQPFTFLPEKFELWQNQKLTESGLTNKIISAYIMNNKIIIQFNDSILNQIVANKIEFDNLVTAQDRLRYINIPSETNTSCSGIETLRMVYGDTREKKDFSSIEPYCCNIFLKNKKLAKITFSFSNPVKLLEFYSNLENDTFIKEAITQSNYTDLVKEANDIIPNNVKRSIFENMNLFCNSIFSRLVNKFPQNIIKRNLISWQDDDFIQYLSTSVELGTTIFIIKNKLLNKLEDSESVSQLVCLVIFSISANLARIFNENGLKNNASLFYNIEEISTLANSSYNLIFDEEVEEKIDFLKKYYLD
jgi:hypothetical protein